MKNKDNRKKLSKIYYRLKKLSDDDFDKANKRIELLLSRLERQSRIKQNENPKSIIISIAIFVIGVLLTYLITMK